MYKRLDFTQYFIDTSNDFNKTGKARFEIHYKCKPFLYKKKLCFSNWEVHYEENRDVIQVHFEETNGMRDWFVNFMFIEKYYDKFKYKDKTIQLKVHNGWAKMYKNIKNEVRQEVAILLRNHPNAEIEVIGWSLGSGQAMLCVQDLYYNFGIKSHLFTYGSVNPFKTNIFNRKKIKTYLRDCCKEVYNFSDLSDIVTYVPFRFWGFIKIKRINLGWFNIFGLFNPWKYHTHYDKEKLYKKIK